MAETNRDVFGRDGRQRGGMRQRRRAECIERLIIDNARGAVLASAAFLPITVPPSWQSLKYDPDLVGLNARWAQAVLEEHDATARRLM
jgi:hypothetical protein